MKVLVLGATGMAGQAFMRESQSRGWQAVGASRNGAEVTVDVLDESSLAAALEKSRPDIVVNTVALVNLAECEKDPGLAYRVNARPASFIAEFARASGTSFVQNFDRPLLQRDSSSLHDESAPIVLLNEYARSKYVGEMLARTYADALVIRTNIVGFRGRAGRPTFVEWAVATMAQKQPLNLFNDFYTSSLDVDSFAKSVLDLVDRKATGIVNVASRDVASKEKFLRTLAARFDFDIGHATVGSVVGLRNTRPADSLGLDVTKAESILGYPLPTTDEVVDNIFRRHRQVAQ